MTDFLPGEVYKLLTWITPVPCVDMISCRNHEGRWQIGLIVRNTGPYSGKYWIVGGQVSHGEHVMDALQRHMRTDLGVGMRFFPGLDWYRPAFVFQYDMKPGRPDFGHDPNRHDVSLTYLVRLEGTISFGNTIHGQEVRGFSWFELDNLPPENLIAYGGYHMIMRARQFLLEHPPTT